MILSEYPHIVLYFLRVKAASFCFEIVPTVAVCFFEKYLYAAKLIVLTDVNI